jgi:hypothetical protein
LGEVKLAQFTEVLRKLRKQLTNLETAMIGAPKFRSRSWVKAQGTRTHYWRTRGPVAPVVVRKVR